MSVKAKIRQLMGHWEEEKFLRGCEKGPIPQAVYEQQCIFIHIPRTAGSSVVKAGVQEVYGHLGIDWYFNKDAEFAAKALKVAFVRNPWDRIHSCYHYLAHKSGHVRDTKFKKRFLAHTHSFEEFVMTTLHLPDVQRFMHFKPQVDYITYRNEHCIDFIGRFESLHQDVHKLGDMIGKPLNLPHVNESNKQKTGQVYNNAMIEKVASVYAKDIEVFNYEYQ